MPRLKARIPVSSHVLQGDAVRLGDVHDVDVVADSGAVERVVVIAVHLEAASRPTATCIM